MELLYLVFKAYQTAAGALTGTWYEKQLRAMHEMADTIPADDIRDAGQHSGRAVAEALLKH